MRTTKEILRKNRQTAHGRILEYRAYTYYITANGGLKTQKILQWNTMPLSRGHD